MKVIGITGHKRAGKNTVGDYLIRHVLACELGSVASYAFAEPIYEMLCVLVGGIPLTEDGEYDKTVVIEPFGVTLRHMLQTLGTEWGRKCINRDIWTLLGRRFLAQAKESDMSYVFLTDVRFDNEARLIREYGGLIIQVERSGHLGDAHESESGIPHTYIDYVVHNDGTVDTLYSRLEDMASFLL